MLIPGRAGPASSQVENNKEVSQQDLEVNWTGAPGHGGVTVTTGLAKG